MLGDILLSIFRIFWYCFGPFLLIAVGFSFFTGKPNSIWSFAKPIVSAITTGLKLFVECCGAIAEELTARLPRPYAGLVAFTIQTTLVAIALVAALWLAVNV